jgi:hypothetical protein
MKAIRVLCLHGLGDNPVIFRTQTGTYALSFLPAGFLLIIEPECSSYSQLAAQTLLLRLR